MHDNCIKVQCALSSLGIETQVVELPESTRSAEEAASAIGCSVHEIAKSLIFIADNEPVLVLVAGSNRLDISKLSVLLGRQVRLPKGKEVKELTGFPIGGVPPVGHRVAMTVVVDEELLQLPRMWAAAGTPHSVFSCVPNDFAQKVEAKVAAIKE